MDKSDQDSGAGKSKHEVISEDDACFDFQIDDSVDLSKNWEIS